MPRGVTADEPPPPPEPLAVEVADAHCHLDIMAGDIMAGDLTAGDPAAGGPDAAAGAVAQFVAAAQAVGVRRVVTIGIDVPTSQWAADAASAHPDVFAAVAIHPNEAGSATEADFAEIERLARLPKVRGIGETGLDFYRDYADPARQLESFRRHIAIAKTSGKALVIHDRDAHDDVLRVLREEGAPDVTVFHCFSGGPELARVCADAGYYLSFAGNVTFKNAQHLRDAAAVAPLDRLLVETDSPYLTPMPFRGRPNAPYLIPLTVRGLAEAIGRDVDELCAALAANTERAFGPWS